jgi:hypothetical protein
MISQASMVDREQLRTYVRRRDTRTRYAPGNTFHVR